MSEFIFVYKTENCGKGWYLKVSTVAELLNYKKLTDNRYVEGFESLIKSKEFCHGMEHVNEVGLCIGLRGSREKLAPIEATLDFMQSITETQLKLLDEGFDLYFNQVGGYHFDKGKPYKQWYRKADLVFPGFTEKDIKIKRFPLGNHYYAYIGAMQVRDNDTLKWNTYEEAYNYAKQYIIKE